MLQLFAYVIALLAASHMQPYDSGGGIPGKAVIVHPYDSGGGLPPKGPGQG